MKKICVISQDNSHNVIVENALKHSECDVSCYSSLPDLQHIKPDVVIFDVNSNTVGQLRSLSALTTSSGRKAFLVALLDSEDKALGRDCIHLGADYFCIKGESLKNLVTKISVF